ncbi:MAG: hypothetical protein KJ561_02600 [Nanoarchaeota archaeon]|nr:hypothetical protein [Nanoarchaeota archaeon]
MDNAKMAVEYYDSINMTETSGTFGYLGEDPLSVYNSYNKMMYYLKYLALFAILSILLISSIIWPLSSSLIENKSKHQIIDYLFKFIIINLISLLLIYVLIFQKLKASIITMEISMLPFISSLFALLIILYFTFIALSIISKKTPKDILKTTFRLGILKANYILLIYLINIITIALFSMLVYLTIELNILLLAITVIFWVFSFVFARLFLIVSIDELDKKLKN